jgi:hypothetical protein
MACCPYTNNRERDEKYATVVTIEYGIEEQKFTLLEMGVNRKLVLLYPICDERRRP